MKTCKFCNESNLFWIETNGRWGLYNKYKEKHICKIKAKAEVITEPKDFRNDPKINKALRIFKEKLKYEQNLPRKRK